MLRGEDQQFVEQLFSRGFGPHEQFGNYRVVQAEYPVVWVPQISADGQSLLADRGRLLGLALNDEDHRRIRQSTSPYVERSHCDKRVMRGRSIEIEHALKA